MKFYEKVEEKITEESKEIEQMKSNIEQKENDNDKTRSENKKNKKVIKILIILLCLLVATFLISTGAALLNINNTKIISGVKVNNIDLEGLKTEQATKKLQKFAEKNIEKDIKLKAEEFEYSVKLNQIELKYKVEEAIKNAYNIGRNENIFLNNFNIIKTKLKGKNIELEYEYNEENLDNIIEDIAQKIPNAVEQVNYSIDEEILTIVKGKEGNTIDKELTKHKILNRILENSDEEISLEVIKKKPEEINIDKQQVNDSFNHSGFDCADRIHNSDSCHEARNHRDSGGRKSEPSAGRKPYDFMEVYSFSAACSDTYVRKLCNSLEYSSSVHSNRCGFQCHGCFRYSCLSC